MIDCIHCRCVSTYVPVHIVVYVVAYCITEQHAAVYSAHTLQTARSTHKPAQMTGWSFTGANADSVRVCQINKLIINHGLCHIGKSSAIGDEYNYYQYMPSIQICNDEITTKGLFGKIQVSTNV